MKKLRNTLQQKNALIVVFVVVFAVLGVAYLTFSSASTPTPVKVAAGTASFTLSPANSSVANGATLSVQISENSGSVPVNTVEPKITYDTSKLEYISKSTSGGAFDVCFDTKVGSGIVDFSCTKINGSTTNNQKVATINFKAKAGTGTTTIQFKSDSNIFDGNNQNIWSGNTTGGTYTLTTPGGNPTPTPTPTPSPSPSSGSGSSGSSSPTTSTPSSGTGSSSSSGSSSSGSGSSAPSNAATPSTEPVTGASQGGATESIEIKVTDADGLAVAGATVVLKDVTAITDSNGIARYFGVTPGSYTISVKTDDGEIKKKITVEDTNGSATPQEFDLAIKPKSPIIQYLIYGGIGVLILAGLTGLYVMFNKLQKKARFRRTHGLDTKKAVVFDSKSSSQPSSPVAQGPMVTFDTKPPAPKPEATAPKAPVSSPKSEPTPGNVITPNDDTSK